MRNVLGRPARRLAVLAGGAMATALLLVPPSVGHAPAPAAALPVHPPTIAGGQSHTIVLDDGSVRGVGGNSSGQLTGFDDSDTLVPVAGLPTGVEPVTVASGTTRSSSGPTESSTGPVPTTSGSSPARTSSSAP